jgi:hypothetical protein
MTDELDRWLLGLDLILDRLRDDYAPDDFPFDYSPESLAPLEALVLDEYPPDRRPQGSGPFLESAMAYLGEALMRVGGGRWAIGPYRPGRTAQAPLACPDEALGLPPVSPLGLIMDALRERTGEVFTRACTDLRVAVDKRRAADPSWAPAKEHSIAADTTPEPATDTLRDWLAARERDFDRWARGYADDPGALDFSRGSLRTLHALVRRNVPGGRADVDKPEYRDFVDGAVWYLGEVGVRTTPAVWQHIDEDPKVNPLAGEPYLQTFGPRGDMSFPIAALRAAADSDDPDSDDPDSLDRTLARFD